MGAGGGIRTLCDNRRSSGTCLDCSDRVGEEEEEGEMSPTIRRRMPGSVTSGAVEYRAAGASAGGEDGQYSGIS